MVWLVVLMVGCSEPSVSAVDPGRAPPGAIVKVSGDHLTRNAEVYLARDEAHAPLQVVSGGRTHLELEIPAEVTPGLYDLVVARRSRLARLPSGLEVLPPVDEVPCSDAFSANTELSFARAEVVVDRFYGNGDRETVRLPLETIERLEYEMLDDGGGPCSVIYLRTIDGKRVVFHDDAKIDLIERAERLAQDMDKPLEVSRLDATAMGMDDDD